ncbi:MAG: transglutaminase family protein [Halioglobus sp.]
MSEDLTPYLHPSLTVNSDHPEVIAQTEALIDPSASPTDNALTLYYWVRDAIRYNPYSLDLSPEGLSASTVLASRNGWCVPKAALLAALCRHAGIPARLGFADVRNHLSTQRMRDTMKTDLFYFHGYTSIYLNDKWVKATPAFNIELCEKFGLKPLEFNGLDDSLYHEFDQAGNKHMEYVRDRGEFVDIPIEEMYAVFREHYPGMTPEGEDHASSLGDEQQWENDIAQETAR